MSRDLFVTAAGLAGSITFTGFRHGVREVLATSDAVLSLSLQPEAFGRIVNEALCLHVPVAGCAHGGVGEQLASLFPAGRVPVGDIGAMSERLADWYQSPPDTSAIEIHSLENMLNATLQLYHRLTCG